MCRNRNNGQETGDRRQVAAAMEAESVPAGMASGASAFFLSVTCVTLSLSFCAVSGRGWHHVKATSTRPISKRPVSP